MKNFISLAALALACGSLAPVAALADESPMKSAVMTTATQAVISPGTRLMIVDGSGRVLGELVSVQPFAVRSSAGQGSALQRSMQPTELKKAEPRTSEEWRAFWNSVLPASTP